MWIWTITSFFKLFGFSMKSSHIHPNMATFCFCYVMVFMQADSWQFMGVWNCRSKWKTHGNRAKQGSIYFCKHLHDKTLWPIGGVVCVYTSQLNGTGQWPCLLCPLPRAFYPQIIVSDFTPLLPSQRVPSVPVFKAFIQLYFFDLFKFILMKLKQ